MAMEKKPSQPMQDALKNIAKNRPEAFETIVDLRLVNIQKSGLDPKTHSLARFAALVALDASPASYFWEVNMALNNGATPDDLVGVLIALAPSVGYARIVSAATHLARAYGIAVEITAEAA